MSPAPTGDNGVGIVCHWLGQCDVLVRLKALAKPVAPGEVLAHLAGTHDLPETLDLIKTRTRRFAKRQGTWFRGLKECRFVDLTPDSQAEEVVERIVGMID